MGCLCIRLHRMERVYLHIVRPFEASGLYRMPHWFLSLSHWQERLQLRQSRRRDAVVQQVALLIYLLYHRHLDVYGQVVLRVSTSHAAQAICRWQP